MKLFLYSITILVLLIVAFVFGSQNEQLIELNYLVARTEMTVATAVSIFTLLGFVIGLLSASCLALVNKLKRKKKLNLSTPAEND